MSEIKRMYPSGIKQPNRNERNPISYWCFKEVRRQGDVHNLGCAHPNDPRYFHEWSNAEELLYGREIQCGRPSNKFCSHKTYYNIAGYRNTCPIAGCNGTYNQPATLQLELSQNHLKNYDIIEGSEIHSITLNFKHKSLGVDVSNGKTSSNWGPNFSGHSQYPDLKVLTMYITDKNGNQKGNVVVYNNNPPLGSYEGVSATFTNITYNDIADGYINIVYQRNLSTNPGNIYIKDLNIDINHTNAFPFISGNAESSELYTANNEQCQTTVSHIIEVGYKNQSKKLSLNEAPKDLKEDVIVNVPKDVSYTKTNLDDRRIRYTFTDYSNIVGSKAISYTLKNNDSEKVLLHYTAKKHSKPQIKVLNVFKHNSVVSESLPSIIAEGDDVCAKDIKVYVDGIDTDPIYTFTSFNTNNPNIIKDEDISSFHNTIAQLPCGNHILYFQIDNENSETMQTAQIRIIPIEYKFKVFINPLNKKTFDDDDICKSDDEKTNIDLTTINYTQCKRDDIRIISIQRIDNEETINPPTFTIKTDTNYQNKEANNQSTINQGLQVAKNTSFDIDEIKTFDISIKYPGDYILSIEEDNSICIGDADKRKIHIEPNHQQKHDVLFVRGEDSTSFDYDYIVAWEGDNIEEPISISEIDIGSTFNDIQICIEKEQFFTGLSQIGLAKMIVTNKSKRTLNNIRIELNVLKKDDDGRKVVTFDEFFTDGIFNNLNDIFLEYNKSNINNLKLLNFPNSIDDDNIEEENVQILIKTLEFDENLLNGDSIEIIIPYMSKSEKQIFIQPLVFEENIPIYTYNNCQNKENPLNEFVLNVYDSILTELKIEGDNDFLEINDIYKQCPYQCFTPELHYKIKNIDSSHTENVKTKTLITNDSNLIPYKVGYYNKNTLIEKNIDDILNQNMLDDIRVNWEHNEKTKKVVLSNVFVQGYINFPNHDEDIMIGRTNSNGEVTFFINIPDDIKKKYTINELLKDVLLFKYDGNLEYQNSHLYVDKDNNLINTINSENKQQVIFDYQKTYKRYKAGDTLILTLFLTYLQKYRENSIIFYPKIQNPGDEDELIVYYEVCNLQNSSSHTYNQGILHTTFETNDYQLVENKISKTLYFGIDTDLTAKANIGKYIVEQNELNVINIQLNNKIKDNKKIKCKIDLTPHSNKLGEYKIVDINLESGESNIIQDENIIEVEWIVGEMNADTITNAQIILKGKEIGLSEIEIKLSDYLHIDDENYYFGESRCDC